MVISKINTSMCILDVFSTSLRENVIDQCIKNNVPYSLYLNLKRLMDPFLFYYYFAATYMRK